MIYRFTLMLDYIAEDIAAIEDSLYEAGCDDALMTFRKDTLYLDFDRIATSMDLAIQSAILDIAKATAKLTVVGVIF